LAREDIGEEGQRQARVIERIGAVFGPDIAVSEADLAPGRLFAARPAQLHDFRRDLVTLVPVKSRIALDDGGDGFSTIEHIGQLSGNCRKPISVLSMSSVVEPFFI